MIRTMSCNCTCIGGSTRWKSHEVVDSLSGAPPSVGRSRRKRLESWALAGPPPSNEVAASPIAAIVEIARRAPLLARPAVEANSWLASTFSVSFPTSSRPVQAKGRRTLLDKPAVAPNSRLARMFMLYSFIPRRQPCLPRPGGLCPRRERSPSLRRTLRPRAGAATRAKNVFRSNSDSTVTKSPRRRFVGPAGIRTTIAPLRPNTVTTSPVQTNSGG